MTGRVIFMLEEASMKAFLEALLPRFFPELAFLCIAHQGKSDLEKSLPKKLRAWNEEGTRFVVLRDNDGADCRAVKQRLLGLCQQAGRESDALVRIVCQELEAWYLGDGEALAAAFEEPSLQNISRSRSFRNPDQLGKPSDELTKRIPAFQKLSGARSLGAYLEPSRNRSPSFQAFWSGLHRLLGSMQNATPQ